MIPGELKKAWQKCSPLGTRVEPGSEQTKGCTPASGVEREPGVPGQWNCESSVDLVSLNSVPFPPSGSTCLTSAPESGIPGLAFLKVISKFENTALQNLHLRQGPFLQAELHALHSLQYPLAAILPTLGRKAHPLLPPAVLLLQPAQG